MACRIQNLGKHRLELCLRGGEVLYLDPQQISPPLREELLYRNMQIADWRKRGVVRWIDVKMSEVLAAESGTAAGDVDSESATAAESKSTEDAAGDEDDGDTSDESRPPRNPNQTPPARPGRGKRHS